MALDQTTVCFPANIVNLLAAGLQFIDPHTDPDKKDGVRIYKRPLMTTDASESIGVIATNWGPVISSMEMRGGPFEPTLQRYTVAIQAMVKDAEEERAIAVHSLLSAKVRHMLYHDPALAVALPQLQVSFDTFAGVTVEKLMKWNITSQNFMNHEVKGRFVYLSTLEVVAETALQ